jgi:short-subunit dehydrogenase
MISVQDSVVLITGGGKGIGRETAKLFAKNKAKVIITGRTINALEDTKKQISDDGGRCYYYQGDVTKIDDSKRIIDDIISTHGTIDILINNAGMSMRGLFEDTTLELFQKVMDINFTGAVIMTKLALPHIIKNRGSIVFVSSLSALKGIPGIAPYGTAKMALTGFSESLRAELFRKGVHIGIVYVGFTENDPNKVVYTATGETMPINRKKNDATQEGVAMSIMTCVMKRKNIMYLTFLGKISKLFYQFFPRLSGYLLRKFALKSEMSKT